MNIEDDAGRWPERAYGLCGVLERVRNASKEALIESWFDSLAAFLWFLSASGKKRNGAQDVRNARMMHNLL